MWSAEGGLQSVRHQLPYYFSALSIFQSFNSLNFARTSGRAVDKLLHGSRVNSHEQQNIGKFVSREHGF